MSSLFVLLNNVIAIQFLKLITVIFVTTLSFISKSNNNG